jgi:hypothetical protein
MSLDLLLDLGLPGIVFLALCFWLVRRAVRAARTERDLEGERLQGAFAEELRAARARAEAVQRPQLTAVEAVAPRDPAAAADVRGAHPAHVRIVEEIAREGARGNPVGTAAVELLWIRSNASHAVWCERHTATSGTMREVICVARIESGAVVERWSFG